MKNTFYIYLPEELLHEILLKLPVKSLLRFKCVSKKWNTLIGSSSFANQHFAHESNQECLLVRHYKCEEEKYVFSLYMDDTLTRYEEHDHLQIPATIENIMGPLNGVFCAINMFRKMAFLNPATRQFKLLPDLVHSTYIQSHNLSFEEVEFGFGLDPLSGDYKLVAIQYFWDEDQCDSYYPCIISVYNSGSDSWKHFEEASFVNSDRIIYKSPVNTYLNEVYYWIMVNEDNKYISILTFDMRNDKFGEIKAPDGVKYTRSNIGLYGDSITLLCDDEVDEFVNVWVMEREGNWSRIFRVGPIEDIHWPLGFWKNNELLLQSKSWVNLKSYNVNTKMLRTFEAHESDDFFGWVFVYKESLVSIKGNGNRCYLWDTSSDVVKNFFKRMSQ